MVTAAITDGVRFLRFRFGNISPAKIIRRKMAECVVEQRRRMRHRGIAFHGAGRTEPGEGERFDKRFQWHAVL